MISSSVCNIKKKELFAKFSGKSFDFYSSAYIDCLQVGLGISTLLMYVPVSLAAAHQSGSLLLLSLAVWLTHELKHVKRIVK